MSKTKIQSQDLSATLTLSSVAIGSLTVTQTLTTNSLAINYMTGKNLVESKNPSWSTIIMGPSTDDSAIEVYGGSTYLTGAQFYLYGNTYSEGPHVGLEGNSEWGLGLASSQYIFRGTTATPMTMSNLGVTMKTLTLGTVNVGLRLATISISIATNTTNIANASVTIGQLQSNLNTVSLTVQNLVAAMYTATTSLNSIYPIVSGTGISISGVGKVFGATVTITNSAPITDPLTLGTINVGTLTVTGTASINNLNVTNNISAKQYNISIPVSNSSVTGLLATFTASVTITFGQVAYIVSTGALQIACASTTVSIPVIAMCADSTISVNSVGNFLLNGVARYDSWNWTVGLPIYTSTVTTTQGLTQTRPSASGNIVQILGIAKSATSILFNPSSTTVEIV